MAYEQRDNSGSLFKNDRKEKETHPDYKGSGMVNGVEVWVSAWRKTSSNGKPFLSMSFQEKEQQGQAPVRQAPARQAPAPQADPDFDSDLPF